MHRSLQAAAFAAILFLISGCLSAGQALFYTHVSVDGTADIGLNGGSFVAAVDGAASIGVFNTGTAIPLVVNGTPLEFELQGQKVVIARLVAPRARIELGLLEPVPLEFQPIVTAALAPARLLELQALGILTFDP